MKICKYNENGKCINIHRKILGIFKPKCEIDKDECNLIECNNKEVSTLKVGEDDVLIFYTEYPLDDHEFERVREEIGKYFPSHYKNKKLCL